MAGEIPPLNGKCHENFPFFEPFPNNLTCHLLLHPIVRTSKSQQGVFQGTKRLQISAEIFLHLSAKSSYKGVELLTSLSLILAVLVSL